MRNNGDWTESKFHSFIKSALRAASSRWPPKYQCLKAAYTETKVNSKTGRQAKHFKCNCCFNDFPQKDVQVDHIQPVIDPFVGFQDWDTTIERMFCEADGFQVLCKECHKNKTDAEKRQAKERRTNERI